LASPISFPLWYIASALASAFLINYNIYIMLHTGINLTLLPTCTMGT